MTNNFDSLPWYQFVLSGKLQKFSSLVLNRLNSYAISLHNRANYDWKPSAWFPALLELDRHEDRDSVDRETRPVFPALFQKLHALIPQLHHEFLPSPNPEFPPGMFRADGVCANIFIPTFRPAEVNITPLPGSVFQPAFFFQALHHGCGSPRGNLQAFCDFSHSYFG